MKSQKEILCSAAALILGFSASVAHADWQMPVNPGLPDDFDASIMNIINWMLAFVATITVLVIIYGGMVYTTSTGDQDRVSSAKKTVKYAIMGLAMAGIAYAAVRLIVLVL